MQKTRMVWLPDDEKVRIGLLVLTEFTNVTDRRTDRQTPHDSIGHVCLASCGKSSNLFNILIDLHF